MAKVSTNTVESYSWGQDCQAWQLVNNKNLSIIEETMPPGSAESIHYHGKAQQFFYVLEGEAEFELGKKVVHLTKGEGIKVKPKLAHRIMNKTQENLRLLIISHPHAHADRINLE